MIRFSYFQLLSYSFEVIKRLSSVTCLSHPSLSTGEDDDDEECGEEKLPSCFDYVMHFLTVFWKVLFAFVPPTEYWNGWACFVVSICMIGLLTAVIGTMTADEPL